MTVTGHLGTPSQSVLSHGHGPWSHGGPGARGARKLTFLGNRYMASLLSTCPWAISTNWSGEPICRYARSPDQDCLASEKQVSSPHGVPRSADFPTRHFLTRRFSRTEVSGLYGIANTVQL